MAEERANVRVVRCPKCDKLLPELAKFSVYRCGGCNATLQGRAKKRSQESEVSSEKSDGETSKHSDNADICSEKKAVIEVSNASPEVNPNGERISLRGEERTPSPKESPISDPISNVRIENENDLKEPEISKPSECYPHYENPSKVANVNLNDKVQEKVEEAREAKTEAAHSNGHPKFRQKLACSRERDRAASAFRRPNPYPDEGPSNYHQNPSKRQNLDGPSAAEYSDNERAELLRKLDELRDQLRRSCEVADNPRARSSAAPTFSSNPYARNAPHSRFPEGSALYRTYSRNSPLMNGHNMDIPNLYPPLNPQSGIHGYRDVYSGGPHSLGRAPFHPPGQYPRPMSNCLYGQFDPDPLVSYHHDGFYHQPACSCLHCCNSHWPPVYSNQRVTYPVTNNGFYPVDGPSVLGSHNYNQRNVSGEPRARQRHVFMKNDGPSCGPVAGAAPFVSCCNCFELLQLPENILRPGQNRYKIRCGSCSQLISFEYDGKRLVNFAPAQTANVTSEDNNDARDGTDVHLSGHPAGSHSGSLENTGYEVHSAEEKLVLPSYPVSSSEMVERGYGFHVSGSEKMRGMASSSSTSEDIDSPDSMICQRDEEAGRGISRVPSLPLREHFGLVDGPGSGSRSRRSEQEKVVSMNGTFKQNSVKDVPVASESDLSADDFPETGLSHDLWEASKDEEQPRSKNGKSGDSFFAGLIKKSFKLNQSIENGRFKVSINGHPISDRLVKKAEKQAGPIHPGNYWYDYRAGFWGVIGHPCLGIIPPFIEEFNYPMPKNCAGGNTGVFVNGRELHHKDLALLCGRGLPATEGQSYIIEISGKVWDEVTGEELDSLGKLAPTVEKVKHGFGMRAQGVAR